MRNMRYYQGWQRNVPHRTPVDDERDRELRAAPPRVLGPAGPIVYRRPFADALYEVISRQGWPRHWVTESDPPYRRGRWIHPKPRGP